MKHLIITSAVFKPNECESILGCSYEQRKNEYLESFSYIKKIKDNFDTITIIECVSKNKVDFLEESGFKTYYSKFDNSCQNKGINEVLHINDFIINNDINDDDQIIKITGRYLLINLEILKYFNSNNEFVAKDDGDIYDPSSKGVHTFLYGFRKNFFIEFIKTIDKNSMECIEWIIKKYAKSNKMSNIIDKQYKLGVITCLYNKSNNSYRKIYC